MKVQGKRFLVTGTAGFIGSHLSEQLVKQGAVVIGLDCMTDYYSPDIKRQNVESLVDCQNFTFRQQNILSIDLEPLLGQVDGVFHLAAQAGVRASWGSEFDEYIDQNIRATQELLEAAKKKASETPIILASSSSVYGIPDELPMDEDMRPVPYSPYGVTKLASEHLGCLYHQNFDLPVVAHRFFTVFGPRQRPDMAFTRFLSWVYRDEPILVFGGGEQTRDFTYVGDVVSALIMSLEKEQFGKIYNVGGGNRASVNETLDTIEAVAERTVKRIEKPMPEGDVPHTDADTSRIREDLDWEPTVSLHEGLRREWDWIVDSPEVRESISAPDSN
jgi:nucleoside-diphosphate-sugar epimerase